jgi:hypothetical protein
MSRIVKTYRERKPLKRYIVRTENFWQDARYGALWEAKLSAWVTAWLLFGGETYIIDTEVDTHWQTG